MTDVHPFGTQFQDSSSLSSSIAVCLHSVCCQFNNLNVNTSQNATTGQYMNSQRFPKLFN